MPIKTLGLLGKIRVGRVTGNINIFLALGRHDRKAETQTKLNLRDCLTTGTAVEKANDLETEAPLDLHLSFLKIFVLSKIYDKPNDFDFDKVNFPVLDSDLPL